MSASKQKSKKDIVPKPTGVKNYYLLLHNDEINTFEYVIECLISICGHDAVQAEQCATITHYKGKCEVKKGVFNTLKTMKDLLIESGLSATIE